MQLPHNDLSSFSQWQIFAQVNASSLGLACFVIQQNTDVNSWIQSVREMYFSMLLNNPGFLQPGERSQSTVLISLQTMHPNPLRCQQQRAESSLPSHSKANRFIPCSQLPASNALISRKQNAKIAPRAQCSQRADVSMAGQYHPSWRCLHSPPALAWSSDSCLVACSQLQQSQATAASCRVAEKPRVNVMDKMRQMADRGCREGMQHYRGQRDVCSDLSYESYIGSTA